MNAASLASADGEPRDIPSIRREAYLSVFVHATLLAILAWFLVYLVSETVNSFTGFGAKLPAPFLWLVDVSEFVRRWAMLLAPVLLLLLYGDFLMFVFLYQERGRPLARLWADSITYSLGLIIAWCIFSHWTFFNMLGRSVIL